MRPIHADDYVRLARVMRQNDHVQLALDILQTARDLMLLDAPALYELARTQAAAGRTDEALASYDAIIKVSSDCLDAHWERGVVLEARGEIDEAMEAWRLSGLTRNITHHSLYMAAALKSPRSTNESLLALQQEWALAHARPR